MSMTRRRFLKRTAGATAALATAPQIIPASAFGANERIGIGFIAMGRRAKQLYSDLRTVQREANVETVAVSDLYDERMNKAPVGRKWAKYPDYRKLLEDKNVDAVIVATPDHWHAINSIHAMEAGKDVYVEKPMTLTIREGRAMVNAARKFKRIVQVGSQQRSMPQNALGCKLIRDGALGKVHTIHGANYPSPWECELPAQEIPEGLNWDMWFGRTDPRPYHIDLFLPRAQNRKDEKGRRLGWISFRPWSGGEMTGWGAHGLDQIQCALGMDESGPVEMWAEEGDSVTRPVSFRYANGTTVLLDGTSGGGGGIFEGEQGSIRIDRAKLDSKPADLTEDALAECKERPYKTGDHMKNWLDCIRSREVPIADVAIGHRSTSMCHLGNIARWVGRKLVWDPEKECFPGDDDANSYIERPMRAPWQIDYKTYG